MLAFLLEIYMFVVSGHLYRPLLLSQPWELEGKIKSGVGTHPPDVFRAGLSILVFFWNLSPGGVHHRVWFEEP